MLPRYVTNTTLEMFHALSHHKKVVIIYPWISYRNIFLTYFLKQADTGLYYYRVPSTMRNLTEFVADLADELFSAPVSQLNLDGADATELGRFVASSLAGAQNVAERRVLFLDELDRIETLPNFDLFIRSLVAALPENAQLAVNARWLNYEPWSQMVQDDEAAVLGTVDRASNLMFTPVEPPKPQLEVYAFGRGYAFVNGRLIDSWDGALPRNLFFYLLDHAFVTRDQIFSIFWDTLTKKEATNVFHVTKRKITECISSRMWDDKHYELTQYEGGFYTASDKMQRHYDVMDFEKAVETAMMSQDHDERLREYRRAIAIYGGPYLCNLDMEWVRERRKKLQQLYIDALIGAARLYKQQQDDEQALGHFIRTLRQAPLREDIHREVIGLYGRLHRIEDVHTQYKLLGSLLQNNFGVNPAQETQDLYRQIIEQA